MTYLVVFKRPNAASKLEVEVDAANRLEARVKAMHEVLGPGAYWDGDPSFGSIILPVERRRGTKRKFETKKVAGPFRCTIEEVG